MVGLQPQIKNNLGVLRRRVDVGGWGYKYKTAFSAILAARMLNPATTHDQKQASQLMNHL